MPRRRILSTSEDDDSTADQSSNETFNKIKTYLDQQFEEFREELPNKKKRNKEKEFKKQSCKVQYEFNEEQLRLVDKALSCIKHKNSKKAKSKLKEIRKNLKKRNKLVKIADKSPGGWNTVKEYETDSVASDTADEKRLKKAEKRALEKIKQSESKPPKRFKPSSTLSRNPESSSGSRYPTKYHTKSKANERCLACGRHGHWRHECPDRKPRRDRN